MDDAAFHMPPFTSDTTSQSAVQHSAVPSAAVNGVASDGDNKEQKAPAAVKPEPSFGLAPTASTPSPAHFAQSHPFSRLLIAEDNAVNQKVLQCMLVRLGYAGSVITVVENGLLALQAVQKGAAGAQQCVSLVLMEVSMPVLGGLDASRGIRASAAVSPYSQPFICALTGNAMSSDREVCEKAGMNFCLSEPVTLKALRDALHRGWVYWQRLRGVVVDNNNNNTCADSTCTEERAERMAFGRPIQ